MNDKLLKLIKQDLTEYGLHALGWVGFIFASWIIGLILGVMFDLGEGTTFVGLFGLMSFGAVSLIMFICGIVAGAEIPAGVRRGLSRFDSFTSESVSAVIVNLLIGPFLLILNMIIGILPGASPMITELNFATLVVPFFVYMASFFIGMFIALLWQRIGWLPTIILIVMTVLITGWAGFNSAAIQDTVTVSDIEVNLENLGYIIEGVVDQAVEGNLTLFEMGRYSHTTILVAIPAILIFGMATYFMTKKLPVKVV